MDKLLTSQKQNINKGTKKAALIKSAAFNLLLAPMLLTLTVAGQFQIQLRNNKVKRNLVSLYGDRETCFQEKPE